MTTLGASEERFRRGLDLLQRACVADHRDEDEHAPDHSSAHAPGRLCDEVASLHRLGRESIVEPDASEAAKYRRLACKQGFMLGCPCERDEDCGGAPHYCLESLEGSTCVLPSDCGYEDDEDDSP